MRIMTSNIWGDFFNNPTSLRKDQILRVYEKYEPDVIGFQEVAAGWYDVDLFEKLSAQYHFVGIDCFDKTNSTPLAVKKEYTIIANGHEQLDNTPDWSKAITWAVIEKGNERIGVCNTHFWWMRGSEPEQVKKWAGVLEYTFDDHCELRSHNAKQLSQLMKHLHNKYSCPVFAFGDMNATVSESVFDVYSENGIQKLYDLTGHKDNVCSVHGNPERGEDGMFHGQKATTESINYLRSLLCLLEDKKLEGYFSSIDHIVGLGDNFEVMQYRVVEDQDALDVSDHSPVYADVELMK
ncbi:MAG: hypothetical protein E7397_03840 [Ruminococcaceae bacterium]|nr:hypothetical protein [Oscillospiraceae bacterium]